MPHAPLDDAALDQLFRTARTFGFSRDTWLDRPVSEDQLHQIWALARLGPTQTNSVPARVVWVKSPEAKARLVPLMDEGNRDKTLTAPVTAILGADLDFHTKMPFLFPHADAREWFEGAPEQTTLLNAWRSSSLQGAYLILAARALGLDAGPQSGFNPQLVNETFFPDGRWQVNFIVNLGIADHAATHPRGPRLAFEDVAQIV